MPTARIIRATPGGRPDGSGGGCGGSPRNGGASFDVWVARYVNPNGVGGSTLADGTLYDGTVRVAKGSSAPNLLGKFND